MKHIIDMPAATECLHDICGLDQGNLMRIGADLQSHREWERRQVGCIS